MPTADPLLIKLIVLGANAGSALTAGGFLVWQHWTGRVSARFLPLVLALLFGLVGGLAWPLDRVVALECGLLAGLYVAAWIASEPALRLRVARHLTPRVIWSLLLVGSLLAVHQLMVEVSKAARDRPEAVVDFQDHPVESWEAKTDRGRNIPLFHFDLHAPVEAAEAVILAEAQYQQRVIRLSQNDPAANCHGWVFTGGQFGIRNADVPAILADNGYAVVSIPAAGDLAVYSNAGQTTHSGIVRVVEPDGLVLIESKWGPFGTFLHPLGTQPFSGICTFYRSPRAGHMLQLRPRGQP
jgi:hypothetical protein